jgi:ATP-dependent RNA helicase DeaD
VSDLKLAETVASRGNNLVFISPPSPSAARAVLAGVLGAPEPRGGKWLALAPAEAVEEWARVGAQLAGRGTLRVAGAHTPARLTRLLHADSVSLVVTPPATAHELVRRAALKVDALAGVLLLWPEAWGGDELATLLLQDLPKDAQRVLVTADPTGSAALIERHCWRAAVTDLLGPERLDAVPPVRSVPVPWGRRHAALVDLVEQLDPESLSVWIADSADAPAIERALAGSGIHATIGTAPEAAAVVVAYDLPSPALLRDLATMGQVILLAPPGTEAYLARLAPTRRPLHLTGSLEAAQAGLSRSRRNIAELLERGPTPAAYFAIAPLLERFEATTVAAGLYELWETAVAASSAPAPARSAPSAVKLWMAIGKRDAVTAHDLVAALMKEGKVPKEAIGKVEIRDTFSLVELGAQVEADQVAERMTGKLIRKRRLVARVDRGREQGIRGSGNRGSRGGP